MMRLIVLIFVAVMLSLYSCKQPENQPISERKTATQKVTKRLIDYKSDTYKLYIGENYKLTEDVIDWGWAGENDPDGMVDSSGVDAFLYLREPLLNYDDGTYLPALHIRTTKNLITEFSCSMLFNLKENSIDAKKEYLKLMSKDISQLRDESIVERLINNGTYEVVNGDYIEVLEFEKGEGYGYDRFEYEIRFK